MPSLSVRDARARRHRRVRAKVQGTAQRPRLAVFRSNRGIEAQLVDDKAGRNLAAQIVGMPIPRRTGTGSKFASGPAPNSGHSLNEFEVVSSEAEVVFDRLLEMGG